MQNQTVILVAAVFAACSTAVVLWRVNGRTAWRATVTPLASIIGSGFLIAAPLLVAAFGSAAIWAMLLLLVVAFALGHVVRFNIRFAEPNLGGETPDRRLVLIERISDAALTFAYMVSVAFYLALLGAFVLRGLGLENGTAAKWITTGLLVAIGALGLRGGLRAMESVETPVVGLKLVIIAGLCAALFAGLFVAGPGELSWPESLGFGGSGVAIILGMLIITQGFETSRYLGAEFDSATRVRTMRNAQLIASGIYLFFLVLVTPYLANIEAGGGVTALVDVAGGMAFGLAAAVTVAAGASQFTAAVADSIASTGLMREMSRGWVTERRAYLLLVPVAMLIVWLTDITELISYASRAFAIYYALQCGVALQAILSGRGDMGHRRIRLGVYALLGVIAFAAALFGLPVEGE